MANFAVIKNGVVINIIVADSNAIAEEVTGETCIEYTTELVEIGGTYENKKFIKRKPFPSWIRVGESDWKSPINAPDFDPKNPKYYIWNETTTSWIEATND